MRAAIIGLPSSGKTTVFDLLTGRRDEPGAFAAPGTVHVGVATVADERVDRLGDILQPRKRTPAHLEFVDLAGLFTGQKANPEAVAAMREADALVKVIRAFDSPAVPHPKGSVDPGRDLDEIHSELFITDLDIIERRIEALRQSVKKPTPRQEEEKVELALLERCREQLEVVGSLDRLDLSDDERKRLSGFAFLTQKPSVIVLNIGEGQLGEANPAAVLGERSEPVVALAAELEKELIALEPQERKPFLEDYGLAELSDQKVVAATVRALGLITFFTANEKELRAWLIPEGSTAIEAAGRIHTDLARGFIRAEVVAASELIQAGSMKDLRAKGRVRLEGRDYIVQDGDLLQIRFSV